MASWKEEGLEDHGTLESRPSGEGESPSTLAVQDAMFTTRTRIQSIRVNRPVTGVERVARLQRLGTTL